MLGPATGVGAMPFGYCALQIPFKLSNTRVAPVIACRLSCVCNEMDSSLPTASKCARLQFRSNSQQKEGVQMKLKRIGVDLAKNVFQVHGVDSHEQVKLRK